MNGSGMKRFMLKILMALLPAAVIVCLALLPSVLRSEETPEALPLSVSAREEDGAAVTIRGSFGRTLAEGEGLWLYAENAEVELCAGGEVFRCNGREGTPAMFRSPGSGWYRFRSPGLPAGEEVTLRVRSYHGNGADAADKLLERVYPGDGDGLYRLALARVDFFTIVLLCATVAGVIYLVEGAIDVAQGAYANGLRISIFGLYCFTGGVWCLPDSFYPYLSLLISPPWLASVLDVLGLILFPIALAVMLRSYIRGPRTRRIMSFVVLSEVVTAVLCLGRQLLGRYDMLEQQFEISVVALVGLGVALLCVTVDLRRYRDNYLWLLLLTVLPVFFTLALDCVNVLFPFMPRRILMRYSFGISVLLLTLQLVSYARAEIERAEKLRQMEQELNDSRIAIMLSQVQPHFLYNALTGIRQLCNTDPQRASDALGHFAYYLRGNMDSLADIRLIPFEKELEHVQDYLYLEEMRFGDRLRIFLELDFTSFQLPPLTLQPLVENAVRHGITKKKHGGTLTIRSERVGTEAVITVRDDGVGFDLSALWSDGRSHIGLENVRNRVKTQCGGTLNLKSAPGTGTVAVLTVPLEASYGGNL